MNAPPDLADLMRLAACLRRPVRRGWLAVPIAQAAILMAALYADLGSLDPVAVAAEAQRELERGE